MKIDTYPTAQHIIFISTEEWEEKNRINIV